MSLQKSINRLLGIASVQSAYKKREERFKAREERQVISSKENTELTKQKLAQSEEIHKLKKQKLEEQIKGDKLINKARRLKNRKFKESMLQGNARMQELGNEKIEQRNLLEELKQTLETENG